MFEARGKKELDDRDRRRASAGSDDFDILFFLADDLESVGQAGQGDDRRAVLIIVENRNIGALLELSLDLEAAGSCNILQVDAAEGA